MAMVDSGNRGFGGTTLTTNNSAFSVVILEANINRNSVTAGDGDGRGKVKKNATPTLALGTDSKWLYGSTEVTTAPVLCGTLA